MTPDPENITAAPVPETTSAAPAVTSTPAELVAVPELASGADQPAPASLTPSDAGAVPPEAAPSLLEKFAADRAKTETEAAKPAATAEVKPGEEKPADGAVDPAHPETKPELPKVDYKYELPATIKMDDGQRDQFHQALDAFRADPEKGAQNLLGMAETMMTSYAEHMGREQWRVFNETRANWLKEVMGDPVLGGAGHDTAMSVVARMRDNFASDARQGTKEYEADLAAFDQFLRVTGAGDNIHFLRLLHNVGRKFDEPPMPPPGARPVPESGRRPGESRGNRMYPTMQNEQP